jgi:CheY-like chemotaxis protein
MQKSKLKILLIEDDRIEVLKLKRSIPQEFEDYTLTLANNGNEAFSIIKNELPDMILLDLNMPDTNGIEFLTIIKANEDFKHIPIVILTTSNSSKDIFECYKLGIAGYVLKPLKYEDYEKKIKAIINYWSLNEFLKL